MNWDEVSGKWNQFKGAVKERWGKLTDDDLTVIAGKRESAAWQDSGTIRDHERGS